MSLLQHHTAQQCTRASVSWCRPLPPPSACAPQWQEHCRPRPLLRYTGCNAMARDEQPSRSEQQPAQGSAACPDASSGSTPSASGGSGRGDPSSAGRVSAFNRSPWELMGRVVSEQRIAVQFDEQLNQGLVRSAAARESGLTYEEFEERLQCLLTLMPFLQQRLLHIQPKLLAALATDPDLIATRLIELRSLLPGADVAAMVGQRPSLLLAGEWERVPSTVAQLLTHYSEEEAAFLATSEPLLLAEDVEAVLEELARLLPLQDAVTTLLKLPSLASNVGRLSHLSLWLAPSNIDVEHWLLSDPRLVYSVQSGARSLGPGAEY